MLYHPKKQGFTLLELTVAMSISGVLFVLTIAWINETMKFSRRMDAHQRQHRQLTRLTWDLRNEVRMSHSMSVEDDTRLILQQSNGQQASYSIRGTTLLVEKQIDSTTTRERYTLDTNSRIHWDTTAMPETIGLIVQRTPYLTNDQNQDAKVSTTHSEAFPQKDWPVDVHIYARIQRWPIEYASTISNGGHTK